MGRRVSIVFEELDEHTFEGRKFNLLLEGMDQAAANRMTPEERRKNLSTAEFYAHHFFWLVADALAQLGIIRGISARKKE